MFGLPDSEAVQDLEAAADYLRALPGATGKVGAIGFCSGGRHTLLFACSSNKVDAAVDCWGGFIHRATPDAETTRGAAEAVARHGRPAALPAVRGVRRRGPEPAGGARGRGAEEARASAAGKDVTTKVYKNAGHAFLADYRPSYREGPAAELWRDAVAFFDKHLKG